MAQTMQKSQNSRNYPCYRVQLNFKKWSYKKTECCIKWKLFHCYVIALAQRGNNSTFLFLYTLRYF